MPARLSLASALLLNILATSATAAEPLGRAPGAGTWIDPAGIQGAVLASGVEVPDAAITAFVDRAGGEKARLLVLTDRRDAEPVARLRKAATASKASLEIRTFNATDDGSEPDLRTVSGVWITGSDLAQVRRRLIGTSLEKGCRGVLSRGGIVAASGDAAILLGIAPNGCGLIPGIALERSLESKFRGQTSGTVGAALDRDAAMLVQGRSLNRLGSGKIILRLGPGAGRPARKWAMANPGQADLTALRREARLRSGPPYPPAKPADPVVPKGTLIIIGGGGFPKGFLDRFISLAGGKKARIVILPTAMQDPLPKRDRFADTLRARGVAKVTVLGGRTRTAVESPEALAALREATGIWFGGGRQWRFVDAYEGTKSLPLMFDVLARGGVIAGSSAGATIQGDYLCRGSPFGNLEIMYEGYEHGLRFLPGVAIDQHFAQRKRFADMTALVKRYPQLLGIGIDETTAIVVRGGIAEVIGPGKVHFYDRRKPPEKGKPDHESLAAGSRYDLVKRQVVGNAE